MMATPQPATTASWTVAEVEALPNREDGTRYELIRGVLSVAHQPHWHHQMVCTNISTALGLWSSETAAGVTMQAPGLVYAEDEAVVPDVVWIRRERLGEVLAPDGRLRQSPDLVVEVVSPGKEQEERDRLTKRALYERRGVEEYWIVDWRRETLEIYRRQQGALALVETLSPGDALVSPLLPGFSGNVGRFFDGA